MRRLDSELQLIEQQCMQSDLHTFDPYDIWKTSIGFRIKDIYNHHKVVGLLPAAALTLFDLYLNDRMRLFYQAQEYPIVRAWAASILLLIYSRTGSTAALESVRVHLDWLTRHSCRGYSGPCWGLGFNYAVSKYFAYNSNTPLATMTPYALEAFINYTRTTGDQRYVSVIAGIYEFLENDLQIMEETDEYLVTSYAAMRDRRVVNAVSYVMYSYSILIPYIEPTQREIALRKIHKLYAYVAKQQRSDGSWLYSQDSPNFVDCFHSCIVIKNLIKTDAQNIDRLHLSKCQAHIANGYNYLKENLLVVNKGLFKRFSETNKPSLIRYDLYDNAEMLNLAVLIGDQALAKNLQQRIFESFVRNDDIYSQIDCFGLRHGKNMLRWASMPYFFAITTANCDAALG